MYITGTQLIDYIGLGELTLIVGARVKKPLNQEVFEAVLTEQPSADFLPDLVEDAIVAQARVLLSIHSAEVLITAYVTAKYENGISQAVIDDSPLPQIAAYLIKYDLMVASDEETRMNYTNAMAQLRNIKSGALSLGKQDPLEWH